MSIQINGKEIKSLVAAIPLFATAATISVLGCAGLTAINAPVAVSVSITKCPAFKSVCAPNAKTIAVWR